MSPGIRPRRQAKKKMGSMARQMEPPQGISQNFNLCRDYHDGAFAQHAKAQVRFGIHTISSRIIKYRHTFQQV